MLAECYSIIKVRRARCEEMRTDQDWPSVWPVAASFRSSVVPLPIRMGSRPHPDRRPPFQKVIASNSAWFFFLPSDD